MEEEHSFTSKTSENSSKDFDLSIITESECTSKTFGNEEIKQNGYYCLICDEQKKMKLCQFCYETCHLKCRINCEKDTCIISNETNAIFPMIKFACDCGIKMKHFPNNYMEKGKISCPMFDIDKNICIEKTFFCGEENETICSFCYIICHKDCKYKSISKEKVSNKKECECKNKNHSKYNEFIFKIPIFEYQAKMKTKFWPIQTINIMFEKGIFDNLAKLSNDIILNYNPKIPFEKEHPFPYLLENLTNIFNRKFKTFYYHEKFINIFSFEPTVKFFKEINTFTKEMIIVKFRLIYIILYIHLKNDFNDFKCYTSIDFSTNSIIERIIFKKFIFSNSEYTKYIYNKYHFKNTDSGLIKQILLDDLIPYIEYGLDKNLINLLEFTEEFNISLKFITFVLKHKLLLINDLEKLIKHLYNIFTKYYNSILKFNNEELIDICLDSFNTFTEIFYIIAVDYNDQVIEEFLDTKKFKHCFIHVKCQHGKLLFQMILKSSILISKHYNIISNVNDTKNKIFKEKEGKELECSKELLKKRRINPNEIIYKKPDKGILKEKILRLFHNGLKIFSITDNNYYFQILNIDKKALLIYYFLNNLFHGFSSIEEQYQNLHYNKVFKSNFVCNLNITLNNLLENFFLNKYTNEDNLSMPLIFISELSYFNKYIKDHLNEYLNDLDNNIIDNYKYIQKLINNYGHLNVFFFQNEKKFNYKKLIYQMCLSNLEEILLKILIIFSDRRFPKYLNINLLEKTLSILSIYLMSNYGTRYLVAGKTLSRLNKLFHRYSFNYSNEKGNFIKNEKYHEKSIQITSIILDFFRLFFKGLKIYNINLMGHKILNRLKKNILSHLKEFYNYIKHIFGNKNENEKKEEVIILDKNESNNSIDEPNAEMIEVFKNHFNIILKIFSSLHQYYQDVDFKEIIREILTLFINSDYNFCDPNIFYSFYYKDYDEETNNKNDFLKTNIEVDLDDKNKINENLQIIEQENKLIDSEESKDRLDIDLIFSFFKLLSKSKSYVPESTFNLLKPLNDFFDFEDNDEKALLRLFKCEKLTIPERKILLNLMQKIVFIEKMTTENFKFLKKQITSKEYLWYLIQKNTINDVFPSISNNILDLQNEYDRNIEFDLNEVEEKVKLIKRIELVINIFICELEFFPLSLINEKNSYIKIYTNALLKGIKYISDFFYLERKLFNKIFIYFYSLALEFLPKTEFFVEILTKDNFNIEKIGYLGKGIHSDIIDKMKHINFNVFNRDEVYNYIACALDDIFKRTNINTDFSLANFISIYNLVQETNFTPFCLIEFKNFEFFYEEEKKQFEKKLIKDTYTNIIEELKENYIDGFLDISKTNYLYAIESINTDSLNYREDIIDYFKAYLNSDIKNDIFDSLLCIITKTLFYDLKQMQHTFLLTLNNQFFTNFNVNLQKYIYRCFILGKNLHESNRFITLANETKLTLQFLQLLGEGFCTDFHDKIFLPINPENKDEKSIFENVILSLEQTIIFLQYGDEMNVEFIYDKLIVLMTNLIDFIIEFLVTNNKYSHILEKQISVLFFEEPKMINVITNRNGKNSKKRSNIISLIKVKFISLLITYIQNGKKYNTMNELQELEITPIELYEEILYNFHCLIKNCYKIIPNRMKELNSRNNDELFVNELIELYVYEEKFRETLELNVCFSLYMLIKIFEMKYNKCDIKDHFKKVNLSHNYGTNLENDDEENWNLNSRFAYRVHKFLEQLILFVEVKIEDSIDPTEEIPLSNIDDLLIENNVNIFNQNSEITFFIRPYLTYFLSKQSINSFELNVNRESATTKYMGLIYFSDSFLFEMITNRNLNSEKGIKRFFREIDYSVFEWINFLLIIIHNLDLIAQHYHKTSLSDDEYNKSDSEKFYQFHKDNILIGLVQLIFLIVILIIWFRYKFFIYYEKNILLNMNETFVYRQKNESSQKKIPKIVKDFVSNINTSVIDVANELNENIPLYKKLKIGIFDSVLLNREIAILVYTLILLILYFTTVSSFFLIIPMLFISNLSPTLFAIFKALKLKGKTLGAVLLLTYLIVYLFSWLAYFYFADDFVYDDIWEINTGNLIYESYCYSALQCYMLVVDFGIRSGGGIADVIHKSSFKTNQKYYISRFFLDMSFHLLIVLILMNIFLGVIVDAFGELRNRNWETERDRKNVCFICQLSWDNCLARNISFEKHVRETHNLWNYVYFLTYLYLGNSNDFNRVEGYVWEKLGKQDYSWLPLEKNSD